MRPVSDIEKALKRTGVETNPEKDERVLSDVLKAFEESRTRKPADAKPVGFGEWIMKNRTAKLTAATAIVLGLGAMIVMLVTGNGTGQILLADVIQRTREAQTVTCTTIWEPKGKPPQRSDRMFKEPGLLRRVTPNGRVQIVDYQADKSVVLDPKAKTAQVSKALFSRDRPNLIEELRSFQPDGTEKYLGTKEIDGRQAEGFEMYRTDTGITGKWQVWADSETHLPIRIETWVLDGEVRYAFDEIRFNVSLDDSLFSTEIPEGYAEITPPRQDPQAARNLMKLTYACYLFAQGHDGAWCDSLEQLVGKYGITKKNLRRPDQEAEGIGYVYVKPKAGTYGGSLLVIHESYEEWPETPERGIYAAFADGHVEVIADEERFKAILQKAIDAQ